MPNLAACFRFARLTLVTGALLSPIFLDGAESGAAGPTASSPSLLLNRADFARINARARAEPWAAAIRDELLRAAEDWPAEHLRKYGLADWAPPTERGGWSGHYICPEHGVGLVFSPGHNVCPVCRTDYHGFPYDYVVFLWRHTENSRAVRDLGLAYQLTGKIAFADKARRILAAYAKLYPTMAIGSHKEWPKTGSRSGGRVTSQTLNESDWVQRMAFGYDLIRDTMNAGERAVVERDILRNASDVIARRGRSLGNWTARHNAAHLAVGLILRDRALIDLALNAEFGFRDAMRRGVTSDGPWHEGSWGYHFYVMEPLFLTREMAVRAGFEVPEAAALRRMLDASLACMLPDGSMPNFNDSGFTTLREYRLYFDLGYRLFGDQRYLHIARGGHRGLEALLWGSETLGEGVLPELGSSVLPEAGFAMLRAPGSDHAVAVKFGGHGGGHGHFDKLNFVSFAFGRLQAVDPGTQSYAFKTHASWDKVTVSHNTVVVDESTQAEATGRLLEWHPGATATAVRVEAGPVYPKVRFERLLVHTAGYTLDVCAVNASDGAEHRFDWVYHNAGHATSPLVLAPYAAFPATAGYQHFAAPRAAVTAAAWEATFAQDGCALRLLMLGTGGTTVVLGTGLGQDLAVPVPFAMARRQGTAARFVTVLEPFRKKPKVRRAWWVRPDVVAVESAEGVDEIAIAPGHFAFTRRPNPSNRRP